MQRTDHFAEQSPIIIGGPHRSGTTLLARLLSDGGVFLGAYTDGNFESRLHQAANSWLLASAGVRWNSPTLTILRPETSNMQVASMVVDRISLVDAFPHRLRYLGIRQRPEHFGWKDPRNTVTWPWWLKVYPNARFVFCRRSADAIASSLNVRARATTTTTRKRAALRRAVLPYAPIGENHGVDLLSSSEDTSLVVANRYLEAVELSSRELGDRCVTVDYTDLTSDPIGTLSSLESFLSISLSVSPALIDQVRPADA